jgi:ABC-type Fe3+ transport system permease subunit
MNFYSLQIMVASVVCGLIIGLDVKEILSNNTIVGYEWLNAIPALPAIFSGFVVWYLFAVFGNLIGDYSDIIQRMLKIDMDDDGYSPMWWLLVLYYIPILIMIVATYLLSIGLARIVN